MRIFLDDAPNVYFIHLEPGLYLTQGGYVDSDTGWKMGNGWTIAGAGVGATTIQLAEFTNPGSGGKRGPSLRRIAIHFKTWWSVT